MKTTYFIRHSLFAILLSMACLPSLRAETNDRETSQPPNNSKAEINSPDASEELLATNDTRLDKVITLEAADKRIKDVLTVLEKETGVTLSCEKEWIENLAVTVFTQPQTARIILMRLAKLLNLSWKERREAASASPRYILWESPKDARRLQTFMARGWDQAKKRWQGIRYYSEKSPDELKRLAEQGDYAAGFFSHPDAKLTADLLGNLTQQDLDRLAQGGTLVMPMQSLSPSFATRMTDAIRTRTRNNPTPPADQAIAEQSYIRLFIQGDGASANISAMYHYPGGGFMGSSLIGLGDPNANWEPWRDDMTVQVRRERRLEKRKAPPFKATAFDEWAAYAQWISKTCGVSVYSDAYPDWKGIDTCKRKIVIPPHVESFASLVKLSESWERIGWQVGEDGEDLFFLHDDWCGFRDYGLGDRIIACYNEQGKRLFLEDVAELAYLRMPPQTLRRIQAVTNIDSDTLVQERGILYLYGSLRATNQEKLFRSHLTWSDLNSPERQAFLQTLHGEAYFQINKQDVNACRFEAKASGGTVVLRLMKVSSDGKWQEWRRWFIPAGPRFLALKKQENNEKGKL